MRFVARTRASINAALVLAAATTIFLSGSAAAQEAAAPAAPAAGTGAAPAAEGAPAAAAGGDIQPLLDKGDAALKAGDYPAAIAAFNEAGRAAMQALQSGGGAENQKAQLLASIGRAMAFAGLKDYESAEKDFRAVLDNTVEGDPVYIAALIARGRMKLDMGRAEDVEDAQDSFQKALKSDANNFEALFGLGKALVLLGRADEAITPLTRAIAGDPKNSEAYRLRGAGYAGMYKTKLAIEDLQKAIELNPDDYEAYFTLGVVDMRLENYSDAVNQFGKAIEHYKPKPGEEDQPYLQGHLTRAAAFIELGKVSKDPAAQKAAYQAAYDETQQVVRQLEAKNPLHSKALAAALFSRGVTERMLGQLGTAIRTFTQSMELRASSQADDSTGPFLSDAYFRRGICFHLIGEDKMAISDFQSAAHLVGDDPRANLWEGFTYAKLGDYQQALRAYGDAIAVSDRYTPAYYNRGLAYMMLGDYEKAIADLNDAIRLEPANAEYYFKRGLAYEQLRENQRASESFAAAIEFDNKHAGAHRHMASVQQSLGRNELSTQYRNKADQLTPPKKAQ